jgi:iron(III)-salmochelin esterase
MILFLMIAALWGCDRTRESSKPDGPAVVAQKEIAERPGERRVGHVPGPRKAAESPHQDSGAAQVRPVEDLTETSGAAPTESEGVRRVGALPPRTPQEVVDPVTVEPIPGYKTRAEYLRFRNARVMEAIAAVTLPLDYDSRPDKRYPAVIAFGGAGECARSPREGALAWMGYYKADQAVAALEGNRLQRTDFKGLVTEERLRQYNGSLAKRPYQGVVLVCPYSPLITPGGRVESPDYEAFVMEELLPEIKRRYRIEDGSVGVDGVSMGGARSMYYGLKHPETFATIGSVQGAFGPFLDTYADLVEKNRDALRSGPWVQLVTSDKDSMAASVEKMHRLLQKAGIPHRYSVLTGPHDYVFNQGPGSLALLLFHNRSLPPPKPR